MIGTIIKIALMIALVVLAIIVFVHVLPWLLAALVILGVVKLYRGWRRPPLGPQGPRWPWEGK